MGVVFTEFYGIPYFSLSEAFFFFPISRMCLALKGLEQMGALTALRVTSWKREDVYRAAV